MREQNEEGSSKRCDLGLGTAAKTLLGSDGRLLVRGMAQTDRRRKRIPPAPLLAIA